MDESKIHAEGYWLGYYNACRELLTSPRMNKPQREIIEEQAYIAKERLEKLGATFASAQRITRHMLTTEFVPLDK